ncbi:MAG: ATP-dependent DNA ligase [Verrucomicrobiota bacterium JB023]|nr:ATP-dependent DNA ligase [Verrucomicrobiota bacterium JB023]
MPGAEVKLITSPHLHLPGPGLALDPHRPQSVAFISHAHADHFARHERIICSTATARLLKDRFNVAEERLQPIDFDVPLDFNGHRLRLLPAGHIFGSAMLHVTDRQTKATLLYTGDFKLRPSRTCQPARLVQADTLIMETTFGLPSYVFPPQAAIESAILHFVRSTLDEGAPPILLGYSLGKAQEAIALLHHHRIPVLAHKSVHEMSRACAEAGSPIEVPDRYEGQLPAGHVLVAPPNAVRSKQIRSLKNRRVAMLSGWAMSPGAKYRYQTDEAYPLSDHADYPALLETVQRVRPRRIYTIHGYTREFAATLRHHGFEAWSFTGDDQIELPLAKQPEPAANAIKRKPIPLRQTEIADLTTLVDEVTASSSRLRKVALLADHLRELPDQRLQDTVAFLSHRLLPDGSALALGTAIIRQALLEATKAPTARYRQVSSATADAARTTRLMLEQHPVGKPTWTQLEEFSELFTQLKSHPSSLQKVSLLADGFRKLHPREAELLVRLLTGDLRAGLKAGLLEEGIAEAFSVEGGEVRRAHMLLGSLPEVALLAKDGRLGEASLRPHSPLSPMLASPEQTAAAIFNRFGEAEEPKAIYLEPKYDGIRAQLHVTADRVSLYSRDLRALDDEFPEILTAARDKLEQACLLDGELIAFAEGKQLNFFDLQKRLGRKRHQGDLFLGEAIPVRFVAFDLLWLEGEDLLDFPYLERRRKLESLVLAEPFHRIELHQARTVEEIESHFKESLGQGHEGLIAKDPTSGYSPGRRGKSWLKLKGVMPTLDCVVVAAQQGHGKRAELLSDYTFAVRDQTTGTLLTLGKAYSGLTDEEIEELTEHFKRTTVEKKRRVHWVEPTVVLEIAFDSINPSKRHNSGLALRFPRIKSIRRDKGPEDIDTLQSARALV